MPGLLKRCSKRCDQCLFSDAKIVSDARRDQVIAECLERNNHFVCHKFDDVACRGFLDTYPFVSVAERMAHTLADQSEELTPYEDVVPPKGFHWQGERLEEDDE